MGGAEDARIRFRQGDWEDALAGLMRLERPDPDELEFRATLRYLLGDLPGYLEDAGAAFEARAADEPEAAARTAAWLGIMHFLRGEVGRSTAWFGTAARIVEEVGECAASAYLQMAPILADRSSDRARAISLATQMLEVAERTGDVDAAALLRQTLGHLLVHTGRVDEGVRLLDEAMLAASSGRLTSPMVDLLVFSAAMSGYRDAHDVDRLREWHRDLAGRPDAGSRTAAHADVRRLYRAELLELAGSWSDALAEAATIGDPLAAGPAHRLRGDILRRIGRLEEAAEAFEECRAVGYDPQPGAALLQADLGGAGADLLEAAVAAAPPGPERLRLLPALVALLVDREPERAGTLVAELLASSEGSGSRLVTARARLADARHRLSEDPRAALAAAGRAHRTFLALGVPYERAQCQLVLAAAHRALGQEEAARTEQESALDVLTDLGVVGTPSELGAGVGSPLARVTPLSPREEEVLALVAIGATNREIALRLTLSPRTVDRHVSNILTKLDLPTRAAAAAHAVHLGIAGDESAS